MGRSKAETHSSSATRIDDRRVAATDEAVVQTGSGNVVNTYNVSEGGLLSEAAIESNTEVALEGLDLSRDAVATIADLVRDQADFTLELRDLDTSVLQTVVTANRNLTESTAERLAELAETKLTDGANKTNKLIALAVGGSVIALTLMNRK